MNSTLNIAKFRHFIEGNPSMKGPSLDSIVIISEFP